MKKQSTLFYPLISVVSILIFLGVWWLVTDGTGMFQSSVLPSPGTVAETFIKKMTSTGWCDAAAAYSVVSQSGTVRLCGWRSGRHAPWHSDGLV